MDIEAMSLQEKIGQLCMFGIEGETLQAETINLLSNHHIGSVFLSKENLQHPKQIHQLTQKLQAYTGDIPLFIATDQAGGEQNSVRKGITLSPNQQTLGQINNQLYTRQIAQVVSEELLAMGINFNLYPSANISENDVTSFGANQKYTSKHVVASVQGCHKAHIATAVRDFPGIGDLQANISASLTHIGPFHKTALQPFIKAIEAGASFISIANELTAHTDFKEPALFSNTIVQKLLRDKLAYDGVIMSEDLLDERITDHVPVEEAAILALEVGVDLLVLSHDEGKQMSVIKAITEAVNTGRLSNERIDQSVTRIVQAKKEFILDKFVDFDRDKFRKQWSVKLEKLLEEKAAMVTT